jgi:dienelactone hydrolase
LRDRPARVLVNALHPVLRRAGRVLAVVVPLAGMAVCTPAARAERVTPPPNLKVDGAPPVPRALADEVAKYGDFRGHRLLDWHPERREAIVARRAGNTTQVFRIAGPGAFPEQVTDFSEPVWNASFPPRGSAEYFLFARDEGGNERYRLFRFDLGARTATAVSPADRRASGGQWTRAGDRFFYLAVTTGSRAESSALTTELRAVDPRDPATDRLFGALPGIGWGIGDVSRDAGRLVLTEFVSVNESYLWVFDVAEGTRRLITPKRTGMPVRHSSPVFTADGKGVLATSDRESQFRRLVNIDIATGTERVVVAHPWDILGLAVAEDGRRLAYFTNEDGASVVRAFDLRTARPIQLPPVPTGSVGNLRWNADNRTLGFTLSSANDPSAVHAIDVEAGRLERWSVPEPRPDVPGPFVEPELVRWKSFDGRTISGYLYVPNPRRFSGPRPVIIDIHGGPESQWRPGFLGRMNYWLEEAGVALLFPNVRGSTGYGKTFVSLDDGMRRGDAVKDIGALLDWIGREARLDAKRVMVSGSSYGGYMSLATATTYPERIACAASDVGIANFVSFLENTESYRRDLRRVEYGDERDPAMRTYLQSISPLTHASRIRRPLLVSHGENDPRVPVAEARSIAQTVRKNGLPVWSLVATDEGHGFAKRANAEHLFVTSVLFGRECFGLPIPGADPDAKEKPAAK